MQLVQRASRSYVSRSFHGSSRCAKQELFEEWQRPLNKTQLKVIHKAQIRNNPKYNGRFQQDANVLLRKAYARTTGEHRSDRATLQQLRDIIRGRAGDRFDVVDISTHTYALPLRRQPAEFLIVDSQYPHGRRPDVPDECSIMYDANAFTALLAEHGFKCFGQYVSKKWANQNVFAISEHGKERGSEEGYDAPVTLHVSQVGLPISSMIPSISFSVTLPHPGVLPLNRMLATYFRIAPEIPQAWALVVLWVRSLGLGTSTPGMRSVDDNLDIAQSPERRKIAVSKSLPYVEELSPTCLALLFLVHLVEAKRLPKLFVAEDNHVVPQENESQHIWVPYTYHSSSHHPTYSQAQATQQMKHQAYPQRSWVRTSMQINTNFACHATNFKFGVKIPKLLGSFFEYLSACAESRHYYYSLRKGAKVPKDIPSRSQPQRCPGSTTQTEHVAQRQPKSWKSACLLVQDPFVSTHNHAAYVSSVTLHRITQCAKMARKWVIRGHPLWAMFGPHLKSSTAPSAFQQPRNSADAITEACEEDNRRSLSKYYAAETTRSSATAPNHTRASPPHIVDSVSDGSGLWGGLIGIQERAAERARVESENLQLLESERMQAKSSKGGQVSGNFGSVPKPPIHRAGQFSRGVHTSATPSLPNDTTVERSACNPQNVNFPQIQAGVSSEPSRDQLIRKVRHVIKDTYGPRYDVRPYGSTIYMGGYDLSTTDNGDLDLVVLDSKWPQGFTPEIDMKHLPSIYDTKKLARAMRFAGFTDVKAIPWARVPIVKFTDPASGLNVDINVNEKLGLLNTGLVKTYCEVVHELRWLVSAIKKWARPRALNQPSASAEGLQTFNSYALVLMTISWLQTRGMAPKLQVGLPPMKANEDLFWMRPPNPSKRIPCDTRYHQSTTWVAPPLDTSLENLVEQWFRFWAQFQFSRHVIDIKRGGIYTRIPHFVGAADYDDIPRGPLSEALLGPDVDSTTMLEKYPISVIDPFIRSKNITSGINVKALNMFQSECEHVVELLDLGVDMADVIDGFDLLKQNFEAKSLRHVDARIQAMKFNANPSEIDGPPQISNHPKCNNGLSVGRIPLSDALESSRIDDEINASPPRVGDEQVRDDEEEGFGLKPSYFTKNRRV